jgi:hypothetical protein
LKSLDIGSGISCDAWHGKSSLFDLGMKVPLVMNWPNGITNPGRTYPEIVSHADISPTLLQLTGASALPTRPVDGVSLVPVFNGSSAAVRDDLFCEIGYARAVRTKDRKYVAELPSGTTSTTAVLNPGIEDIVIEVASYNALGDTPVTVDLLAPESWRYRTFGDVDPTLSLPISQWAYDADGDGVTTLWEYASGTNPRLASSVLRPELRIGSGERTGVISSRTIVNSDPLHITKVGTNPCPGPPGINIFLPDPVGQRQPRREHPSQGFNSYRNNKIITT